jgi:hypothetical protein
LWEAAGLLQGENAGRGVYQNPSAAITSAVRKELDKLRPPLNHPEDVRGSASVRQFFFSFFVIRMFYLHTPPTNNYN